MMIEQEVLYWTAIFILVVAGFLQTHVICRINKKLNFYKRFYEKIKREERNKC